MKGGVQRVTQVLCDYFRSKGHLCYYLSTQQSNEGIENQFALPSQDVLCSENIDYLTSFVEDKQIDVVVNQDGFNKGLSKLVFHSCRCKVITVAHNSLTSPVDKFTIVRHSYFKKKHLSWFLPLFDTSLAKFFMKMLYRRKYRQHYLDIVKKSFRFVLLSNAYKKELDFFIGNNENDNVCAIPNPCTIDYEKTDEIAKEKVVLYVGRVSFSQKRNDLLLKVWQRLESKHSDWTLKIVGDGSDMQLLKDIAADMNLHSVEFLGFRNPIQYYKQASIFCLTSAYEGFVLVLVEAMKYKCVPICFDSFGAASDIIYNGIDGYLVKPFDLEEYSSRLNTLMSDNALLRKMSVQADIKSSEFDIDTIGNQWLNLFSNKEK